MESILHGSNSPRRVPPRPSASLRPAATSALKIYFTTKQKISERLGLRWLGLLHGGGSNHGGIGHGGDAAPRSDNLSPRIEINPVPGLRATSVVLRN